MVERKGQEPRRSRRWQIAALSLGVIAVLWLAGPQPDGPHPEKLRMNPVRLPLRELEDSIHRAEAGFPLRPDNEARIVWARPYEKTAVAMVYIHGNGASQEEGDPIHEALAARYGCNLFLARLADHGLRDSNALGAITADRWLQSALDAILIGHAIGEKVIVVSCSTGSTLALFLAARFPDLVDGHILLSPNIDMKDPRAFVLAAPWGLQVARKIAGSEFYSWSAPQSAQAYWYTRYRIEGLTVLKTMINATMTRKTFMAIREPVLLAYYDRDEAHQDDVVSVRRMEDMYAQLGTPEAQKRKIALPNAGNHIIASDMFAKDLEDVWKAVTDFCESVLGLIPLTDEGYQTFIDPRKG